MCSIEPERYLPSGREIACVEFEAKDLSAGRQIEDERQHAEAHTPNTGAGCTIARRQRGRQGVRGRHRGRRSLWRPGGEQTGTTASGGAIRGGSDEVRLASCHPVPAAGAQSRTQRRLSRTGHLLSSGAAHSAHSRPRFLLGVGEGGALEGGAPIGAAPDAIAGAGEHGRWIVGMHEDGEGLISEASARLAKFSMLFTTFIV
jgi:hypothetical protein